MNQQLQDSLNNSILGLELNVVYIQDQSTSKYLSEDVIKAFKIIEKEQKRLDTQLKECQAIKQKLQNKSQQIDAKLRGYQQLEDRFIIQTHINEAVNEKINQFRNEKIVRINSIQSNINKMVNEKINQIRINNEQLISKYLRISKITLILMVICFCLASSFFYQRLQQRLEEKLEETDQRLTRQLNKLNKVCQMTSGYLKRLNEVGKKDQDNILKFNERAIEAQKQEVRKGLLAYEEKQKHSLEREKELETKLIKASFWWGGSWSELQKKEQLNLGGQNLDGLPEKLQTLKKLTVLSLQQNQLTELPQSLGNLKELRQLNVKNNQLTKVPQSLGNLKELRQLYLNSNQLTKLPESLGDLSKLQTLSIRSNPNLKQLPKSFKNLKELNVLGIDWQLLPKQNIFKTEPFTSLKNLQKLYIDNDERNKQMRQSIKKEGQQMKVRVYFSINDQWQ